ncbi:MAG: glycosyltransferase family 39 protein [Chloroflexi bacterium]|nr:glycosyltransferase family 39 protein [Chloroflexota bacterium]
MTLLGAGLRLIRLDMVPPGLHFDEAVYGLQAWDIYRGSRPIFFPAYTGREPLYMYVMAIVFRLVGIHILGIRLTSALIGIVTIPLVYLLMRELFGARVGLLAGALLALSYWHLTVSRNGYPNILIPPLECLAMYGLWRGYRDGRIESFVMGGAVTGLVLYTYLAARFFPITVLLFFIYAFIVDKRRFRLRFGGLLLAGLIALLVFAPLGVYFLRHPEYFWERANQVLIFRQAKGADAALAVLNNLVRTWAGFFWAGDPRPHFNLPGRPILSLPSAVLFLVGLLVAVSKWRRPEYMLLPIWLVGMSLPAALTKEAMPQGQRMFGITPALYTLVALGIESGLCRAAALNVGLRRASMAAVVGLLAYEGLTARYTYFDVWAIDRQTFYTFHADYVQLAEQARRAMEEGYAVVLQAEEYKHPTVVFVQPRTTEALWTAGQSVFVVPNRPAPLLYLWPCASNPLEGAIQEAMERLVEPVGEVPDPFGKAMIRSFRLRPKAMQMERAAEAMASFGNSVGQVDVLSWELPRQAPRDEPLEVLVRWRVNQPGEGRVLGLHLLDEDDVLWAQDRQMGYFREQWQTGDVVYQLFHLRLPPGIPPGPYRARLVFGPEEGDVLPLIVQGRLAGTSLDLGEVELEREGAYVQPIDAGGVPFGSGLRILDYDVYDQTVSLGGRVQRAVAWQKVGREAAPQQIAIELVADGHVVARHELPLASRYPVSEWRLGEVVRIVYTVEPEVSAGEYALRLRALDREAGLHLGHVRVMGRRSYQVPAMEHRLEAELGTGIELLGFDLAEAQVRPGELLTLRLYWRASAPQKDYKVFVHLVGADEQIIAQDDARPAQWQRPTTSWDIGEVIVDEHVLAIPDRAQPGDYQLYVGMYHAVSFARLPIRDGEGHPAADDRLSLGKVTVVP